LHERTMLKIVTVAVPATTANLGPGFDCLALTLDLWNEVSVSLEDEGLHISVEGEGSGYLPSDDSNPIVRAALDLLEERTARPRGLRIACRNRVPPASGLGSSATAVLAGLIAANSLLGGPLTNDELMARAVRQEGHPDNVAAALYGGLVVVVESKGDYLVRRFDVPRTHVAVIVPAVSASTRQSRESLPETVSLTDAVHNLGRATLVVEALRTGDLALLGRVMDDRLHQPARLGLIPGAVAALAAGREGGTGAVALSGSGPSLIAFAPSRATAAAAGEAMAEALRAAETDSRVLVMTTTTRSARLEGIPQGPPATRPESG
jgi:homoserine kinase